MQVENEANGVDAEPPPAIKTKRTATERVVDLKAGLDEDVAEAGGEGTRCNLSLPLAVPKLSVSLY
jgi:hypothetical protein